MNRWIICASMVALLLLASGCGDDDSNDGPAIPYASPALPGPYPVGFTTFEIPEVAGLTNVPVELWYPAAAPGDSFDSYLLVDRLPVMGEAYRDVAPDPAAPSLLIAFSHGLGGVRQQNFTMAERLASFGYIVVSADHPGTTVRDLVSSFGDLSLPLIRRPATVKAAVDAVFAGVVPGVVPRGDTYGFIGHSLGAITGMALGGGTLSDVLYMNACNSSERPGLCNLGSDIDITEEMRELLVPPDPRIAATILQAPAGSFAFEPGTLAMLRNALVMGGRRDGGYLDGTVPVFTATGPGSAFLAYDRAGHNFPTNMCDIPVVQNLQPDCDGPAAGFREPAELREVSNRHAIAWMGIHLGGQPAFHDDLGPEDGVTWESKQAP